MGQIKLFLRCEFLVLMDYSWRDVTQKVCVLNCSLPSPGNVQAAANDHLGRSDDTLQSLSLAVAVAWISDGGAEFTKIAFGSNLNS